MKSGEAHCDQELADKIRRGGGRTRKDEEGRGRTRKDEEGRGRTRWRGRRKEEGGRRKEEGRGMRTSARSRASDIKSNNPHLAGGEKTENEKKKQAGKN